MSNKVSVKCDGTPEGTSIEINGKPVDCVEFTVSMSAGDRHPKATLVVYVDALDVQADIVALVDATRATNPPAISEPMARPPSAANMDEVLRLAFRVRDARFSVRSQLTSADRTLFDEFNRAVDQARWGDSILERASSSKPTRTGYTDADHVYHPAPDSGIFDADADAGCISCKLERENPESGYVKR